MNDFQKELIARGFIPVDESNFYNLITNEKGLRVLIHISKESSSVEYYRVSTHSYIGEKFQWTSFCISEDELKNITF